MDYFHVFRQEGPVCVCLTQSPNHIYQWDKSRDYVASHVIELHGKCYHLFISGAENMTMLRQDKHAATRFARDFICKGNDEFLDIARILFNHPRKF
ncbi:hypothetical protein PA10_00232 [Pseudomonas phage pPa_SNUABM_DT01]|nr:hypothetical protein PA10_00232 [Pseudomonas phage pPa_SNUABM_DT01]